MTIADRYGPWALVTGASDGIGLETARHLAASGVNVVLAARREPALRALAEDLERSHQVQTRVVAVDLSRPGAAAEVAEACAGVDVGLVVLAAGFGAAGPFLESPLATATEMIGVNVTAVTVLAHVMGGRLAARGRGGIILFGSLLGWQGVPGQATYAATKAYVQALAEGLHSELADRGVDVVSVAPGPVHTGFAARAGMTMRSATAPDVVAAGALRKLGRGVTVVPGVQGRLLTLALAPLPRRFRTAILGRVVAGMADTASP
ncbi:short-chain dehydrogenase [Mycobacterium sp. Soil538]|nr:short-chain dehydrogenase [Mycobacterium sp. Soil538]